MKHNKKVVTASLVVLFSLIASLIFPVGVLADDNQPPPTEAPEIVPPPEGTPTGENAAADPVGGESATEDSTVFDDSSQATPIDMDPAVSSVELLAQLPEGTDLVVLNENGNPVPLASQEAAEILVLPDPQFCPTGYLPGAAQCGAVRTTIQAAVNDAKAAGVAGTVYIQSGTFNENVTIADFTVALTLQGVFSLSPYTVLTNPANRPVINGQIFLIDGNDNEPGQDFANRANITLADLVINNSNGGGGDNPAIFADRNTAGLTFINLDINAPGSGNSGLLITNHSGSVFLTNVDASGTANVGANINNTSGTGNVIVTDSVFNQNNNDGLQITSRGLISLVNVTANQNGGDGAQLDNNETGSTSNIEVIKSTFNTNNNNGLAADSNGNVLLINVTAQNNGGDGVSLAFPNSGTHAVTICGGTFTGQSGGGGNDYNVQVTNGDTLTRTTNHNPYTNWGTLGSSGSWSNIANGGGLCNYPDTDTDQLPNQWDVDDDNDGVTDASDACPVGASIGTDTDGDGCKNTTEDNDNDNDGVLNGNDACSIGAAIGLDTDGDGCKDIAEDSDDDNDGVLDVNDAFPLNPAESVDTDSDGTGNNADTDDDNDGVLDVNDAFPLDPAESVDTDGDGTGNNTDVDDDNDTILDINDACSTGASVGTDTDGDGCKDTTEDTDNDNDGVLNLNDAFPLDPTETTDTDGDGVGDNTDVFPNDPTETIDTDGDGVGDNSDAFPNDPTESGDADGDGVGDNSDAFPNDPTESGDADGDGVGDNNDAFPNDPTETVDTDGDGVGDNRDAFPLDPARSQADNEGENNGEQGGDPTGPSQPEVALFIPVTGDDNQSIGPSCAESTVLEEAGFRVAFANVCEYSAALEEAPEEALFGALPAGNKFIGGIDIGLLKNGSPVDTMPSGVGISLSFEVPTGMTSETIAILFWDSATGNWIEKSVTAEGGKVTLTIDMPGTYVLVEKSITTSMEESSPVASAFNNLYLSVANFFKQFALQ